MKAKALFIGDSITAAFDLAKYFPEYLFVNKAISGDSTLECLERISITYFNYNYDFIFICIGTNDIARGRTNSSIIKSIETIVTTLKKYAANTKIVITTLFPTRDNEPRPNERIIELNKELEYKAKYLGELFFNLHPNFLDSEGKLKQNFTDDGLHLTESAYHYWAKILELFINKYI